MDIIVLLLYFLSSLQFLTIPHISLYGVHFFKTLYTVSTTEVSVD